MLILEIDIVLSHFSSYYFKSLTTPHTYLFFERKSESRERAKREPSNEERRGVAETESGTHTERTSRLVPIESESVNRSPGETTGYKSQPNRRLLRPPSHVPPRGSESFPVPRTQSCTADQSVEEAFRAGQREDEVHHVLRRRRGRRGRQRRGGGVGGAPREPEAMEPGVVVPGEAVVVRRQEKQEDEETVAGG
jgi:hypothetical protein